MSKPLKLFVPIMKVDAEKRLVYGRVADETPDAAGEVFDYTTSKPYFEKWSGDIAKASGGKSLGNVRVMHTAKAAGKVTDIFFDDSEKAIDVVTKCVDDDEWKKIEAGVYTGFSMGGAYVKKWKDGDNSRYTGKPVEISYVDAPCIPTATFELSKGADAKELRKFTPWEPTAGEIAAEASELAKAAGKLWTDCITEARASLIAKRRDGTEDSEELRAAVAEQEELNKAMERTTTKETTHEKISDDKAAAEGQAASEDEVTGDQTQDGKGGSNEGDSPKGGETKEKKETKVEGLASEDDEPADDGKSSKEKEEEAEKMAKAKGELVQVWQATDGKTFAKKDEAAAHQVTIVAGEHPLTKAVAAATAALKGDKAPATEDPLAKALEAAPEGLRDLGKLAKQLTALNKMVGDDPAFALRKSVWDLSSFASAISSLAGIQQCLSYEADYEKDGSGIPKELRAAIAGLVEIFLKTAAEEMGEMLATLPAGEIVTVDVASDPEVGVAIAQNAKAMEATTLAKRGARNSKADMGRLQKIHDYLVELGVACPKDTAEKLAKAETDNATLNKVLADALPAIEQLKKDITDLKSQPMPGGARLHVMEKGGQPEQGKEVANPETVEALLKTYTPEQLSVMMIRLSQQNGQHLINRG